KAYPHSCRSHQMKRIPMFAVAVAVVLALGAAEPASPQTRAVQSEAGSIVVETLATGLDHPWGMAFLPDGGLLVTERAGRLRILRADGSLSDPLDGTPEVLAEDQGGLLD